MGEFHYVTFGEVVLRLLAAGGFAFIIGLEREIKQKSFGLRTHMLLSIGTAAFVLLLMELTMDMNRTNGAINIDPARVIEGIIAGISFLGAGSIIRSDDEIKGATTGGGIWVLGGIGLACGLGLYLHAALITALILLIVVALQPLDRWLAAKVKDRNGDE